MGLNKELTVQVQADDLEIADGARANELEFPRKTTSLVARALVAVMLVSLAAVAFLQLHGNAKPDVSTSRRLEAETAKEAAKQDAGVCKQWCSGNKHKSTPWSKKCNWKNCNGCTACTCENCCVGPPECSGKTEVVCKKMQHEGKCEWKGSLPEPATDVTVAWYAGKLGDRKSCTTICQENNRQCHAVSIATGSDLQAICTGLGIGTKGVREGDWDIRPMYFAPYDMCYGYGNGLNIDCDVTSAEEGAARICPCREPVTSTSQSGCTGAAECFGKPRDVCDAMKKNEGKCQWSGESTP